MNPGDLLIVLAEVSIAFVGFASIVAVLQANRTRPWSKQDRFMFRAMVEAGILNFFTCVFPHAIGSFDVQEATIWSGASAISLVLGIASTIRRFLQSRQSLDELPMFARRFILPVVAAMLILHISNALYWQAAGPYVVSVLLSILYVSGVFLFLVIRLFPIIDDMES